MPPKDFLIYQNIQEDRSYQIYKTETGWTEDPEEAFTFTEKEAVSLVQDSPHLFYAKRWWDTEGFRPEEKIIQESLSKEEVSAILDKYRGALASAAKI